MALPKEQIQKLATLSRLKFEDAALTKFSAEFDNIITFVEKIQQANTSGVLPMTSTIPGAVTPQREDKVTESNRRDDYQKSAPATEMGFYVVPKIVE